MLPWVCKILVEEGENLLIFSQVSFYFLWQLEPGYTLVMILQVPISSAKRKIEISPLSSFSEKDQLSLMITELRLSKTCNFCFLFPLSCTGRRDGIKWSGFSEEGTFGILPQGLGKQSALRSTP